MNVHVECYSGRKADEGPVRFRLEGREYSVKAVLDPWYDPESIFYKVPLMMEISISFDDRAGCRLRFFGPRP
jgi:hypothetical protein